MLWSASAPHAHAEKKRLPSTQADVAFRVGMSETHFSNVFLSLKHDGWFIEHDDGLIRPNPSPPKEGPVEQEAPEPHVLYPELPTRDAFRALQDPELAGDLSGRAVTLPVAQLTPVRISTHAEESQWLAASLGWAAVSRVVLLVDCALAPADLVG